MRIRFTVLAAVLGFFLLQSRDDSQPQAPTGRLGLASIVAATSATR